MWITVTEKVHRRQKNALRTARRRLKKCRALTDTLQAEIEVLRKHLGDPMSLFNGKYQSPQKTDGTVNAGGKVYFYETGTSTFKSVYTDEALTTAHANPVILDAAGAALIFLAEGSYDYKVDDSDDVAVVTLQGPINSTQNSQFIKVDTAWAVDGVGATSSTFATIAAAMDEAREFVLMAPLTITIDDGTYLNDIFVLDHPQGQFITLQGQTALGCIIQYTTSGGGLLLTGGMMFGAIKTMTIERNTTSGWGMTVNNASHLADMSDVIFNGNMLVGFLSIDENSSLNATGTVTVFVGVGGQSGCLIQGNSRVKIERFLVNSTFYLTPTNVYALVSPTFGITVVESASFVAAQRFDVKGGATGTISRGINCRELSKVVLGTNNYFEDMTVGIFAQDSSLVEQGSTPTFTSVGTSHTPVYKRILSITDGSADLSLIT